ncbi:MAG: type II secretion system F family protein [Alphaproteobacteria bacterium]|nr:type II secretion system F family protein [Alphaproteobacteria bacterium]MBF0250027.1 type II secretion system F family protein [Alphaproteobacteria bacterium]
MDISLPVLLGLVAGVILILVVGIGSMVMVGMKPKVRLKKRIDAIGSVASSGSVSAKAESRRQKRIQDKLKGIGAEKKDEGMSEKIEAALLQAGLQIEPSALILGSLGLGVVLAAVSFFAGAPMPAVPAAFVVGAFGVPKIILGRMAKSRQNDFTSHFAEAIDVITRGIRSGLPVGECLAIISREFHGPLGEEFTMIVEGQKLGMTLEEILVRALKRVPTAEFKFFAIVLQIQKQTGGNLADTLDNLSEVLRDRKRMKDKIQALSSEAKSSAAIIAALPFAVLGMLSLVNPAYVAVLFGEGIHLVFIGLGMMGAGVFVMGQMINFDI